MRALLVLLALVCLGAPRAWAEPVALSAYVGNFLTMDVEIQGQRARLLFDTGAGITSITPAFAARVGCTPYGAIIGFRVSGERVAFQKCADVSIVAGGRRTTHEIGVFDVTALLPADWPPIDGVIGLDAFEGAEITLNLVDRELSVGRRTGRDWRQGDLRLQREMGGMGLTAFARVEAQTGSLWMLLDSGNMGPTLLSPGALAQLNATAPPPSLFVSGAGAHAVEAALLESSIYDGNLSWAFLRDFEIAFDLRRSQIWWRPAQRAAP